MTRQWFKVARGLGLGGVLALTGCFLSTLLGNSAFAQIIPDETLGAENSFVTPNVNINAGNADRIDGGATRGTNLFHSFEQFNVGDGQRVYFANPVGIENILSRVTGTNASNILGTLGVTGGNANLFFINPNGIIFGTNATLDVQGSFVASTADSVVFDNGFVFSSLNPQALPLLTIIAPLGLQYGATAGAIRVSGISGFQSSLRGLGLRVPPSKTLALIGGEVALEGTFLEAPGGRIELGSVANPGQVSLNPTAQGWTLGYENIQNFQNILVLRSLVDTSIEANDNIQLPNSDGDIAIRASHLDVGRASVVRASTFTALRGGDITINVRQLTIREGAGVLTDTLSEGSAGDLTVNASESVIVTGSAGGGSFIFFSILSTSANEGTGDGGNLTINTKQLLVQDGAIVLSNTDSSGAAGSVTINADTVSFDGQGRNGNRSGAVTSVEPGAMGNGGKVTINAHKLSISNGAVVSSNTFAQGNAGSVTINADTIMFDGKGRDGFGSGAFSRVSPTAVGNGSNVTINARTFLLTNGAQVNTQTQGQGDAGKIEITANTIDAASGGRILSDTSTNGSAGDITIQARERFTLSGADTGVFADTKAGSTGIGGNIEINSPEVSLSDRAAISVSSKGAGVGGNIEIQADTLTVQNQARLLAETASNTGGNITLKLQDLLLLRNESKISTTAGTDQTGGDGGNITIDTDFIVAVPKEDSDITANAFQGRGGNINITATGIYGIEFRPRLTPLSDITASSEIGVDGVVEISTLGIDPVQGIVNLPAEPTTSEVAQDCQSSGGKTSGSFINTGRGGLPTHPYEPLTSSEMLTDVQPPSQWVDNSANSPTQRTSDRLVEANGWLINENGEVVLVAQSLPTSSPWGCSLR